MENYPNSTKKLVLLSNWYQGLIITSINGRDPSTFPHKFRSTISQKKKEILERTLRFEWKSIPISVLVLHWNGNGFRTCKSTPLMVEIFYQITNQTLGGCSLASVWPAKKMGIREGERSMGLWVHHPRELRIITQYWIQDSHNIKKITNQNE